MKKVLIILAVIVAIFIAVPFFGNKIVASTIQDRVELLTSYGLKVKESTTDSGYLSTKKHFIFVVEDSQKFIIYLRQFRDAPLPSYLDALIDGAEVGLDIKYSNIVLNDSISIDIYPRALSKNMTRQIQRNDADFYRYLDALLKEKKVSYHLEYSLLNKDFNGYIKDIDTFYSTKNGIKISILIEGAKFDGEGLLVAPDSLSTGIKNLHLAVDLVDEHIKINLSGFSSTSVFKSKTTYATTLKLNELSWNAQSIDVQNIGFSMKKLFFDFSANTQSQKADFFTKTSFDSMLLNTTGVSLNIKKFNYDLALAGVDKEGYISLLNIFSKTKENLTPELEEAMRKKMLDLLSRGMVIDLADFSIKKFSTLKTKNLGGLDLKAKFTFKKDANLAQKLETNPLALMQSIDVHFLFVVSKMLYLKIATASPVLDMVQKFAKKQGENIMFDIKLEDAKLSINGREIR